MDVMDDVVITFLPAGIGDCALLQFAGGQFNLLIDAGPSRPGYRVDALIQHLYRLLPDKVIDVAVVTHHDDDHIGGFIKLFGLECDIEIRNLIFNAPFLVKEFLDQSGLQKISPRQGHLISMQKRPAHHEVLVAQQTLSFFDDQVELLVLSPTREMVEKHGTLTQWFARPSQISPARVFRPYEELKQQEDAFIEDTSRSNCLSLAFEIRFKKRSWLFLGDAWPSIVSRSLEHFHPDSLPTYDLVKLSHHGSQGNTNADLLSRFSCRDYVVPANGREHPHEQVFRRVMDACATTSPRFHFPERTVELERLLGEYLRSSFFPENNGLLQFHY